MNLNIKCNEEGNNIYSIALCGDMIGEKKYFMDKGKFIIDCINENLSSEEIIKKYSEKYKKPETLSKDEITSFLSELELFEIIPHGYKEKLGFINELKKQAIKIVSENDTPIVSDYIIKCIKEKKYDFLCINNIQAFGPYAIRARIFSNKEVYFYETDNEKNIIGIMGIQIMDKTPTNILVMCSDKKYDYKKLFTFIEAYLNQRGVIKIKACFPIDAGNINISCIESIGLEKEAVLVKEFNKKDLLVYSKLISE